MFTNAQQDTVHTLTPESFKTNFNIILPSMLWSSSGLFPLRFPYHQNCLNFLFLPCMLHFLPISLTILVIKYIL